MWLTAARSWNEPPGSTRKIPRVAVFSPRIKPIGASSGSPGVVDYPPGSILSDRSMERQRPAEKNGGRLICDLGCPMFTIRRAASLNATKKRGFVACLVFALLAFAFTVRPVGATLGESADSIEQDRRFLSATRGSTVAGEGYEVQEIHSDAVTIREYISPSGFVFGIAWDGPLPDLAQVLGPYAGEYQEALRRTARVPGRPFRVVKANGVVVETWGLMRDLHGRAYSPELVPPGVPIDVVK